MMLQVIASLAPASLCSVVSAICCATAFLAKAAHSDELDPKLDGIVKIEFYDRQTRPQSDAFRDETDLYISKIEVGVTKGIFDESSVKIVIETEDIGKPEFEPVYVKELLYKHHYDGKIFAAGRMALPFGFFDTAVVSDPWTKDIGETKTDIGLGIGFLAQTTTTPVEWNIFAYADDYRTQQTGAQGITANLHWDVTKNCKIGAGYLDEQHARINSPAMASAYMELNDEQWTLAASAITALDGSGGEKPSATSLDLSYRYSAKIRFGLRRQNLHFISRVSGSRIKHEQWAIAAKYFPTQYIIMGIEYADEITQEDTGMNIALQQLMAQFNIMF